MRKLRDEISTQYWPCEEGDVRFSIDNILNFFQSSCIFIWPRTTLRNFSQWKVSVLKCVLRVLATIINSCCHLCVLVLTIHRQFCVTWSLVSLKWTHELGEWRHHNRCGCRCKYCLLLVLPRKTIIMTRMENWFHTLCENNFFRPLFFALSNVFPHPTRPPLFLRNLHLSLQTLVWRWDSESSPNRRIHPTSPQLPIPLPPTPFLPPYPGFICHRRQDLFLLAQW